MPTAVGGRETLQRPSPRPGARVEEGPRVSRVHLAVFGLAPSSRVDRSRGRTFRPDLVGGFAARHEPRKCHKPALPASDTYVVPLPNPPAGTGIYLFWVYASLGMPWTLPISRCATTASDDIYCPVVHALSDNKQQQSSGAGSATCWSAQTNKLVSKRAKGDRALTVTQLKLIVSQSAGQHRHLFGVRRRKRGKPDGRQGTLHLAFAEGRVNQLARSRGESGEGEHQANNCESEPPSQ